MIPPADNSAAARRDPAERKRDREILAAVQRGDADAFDRFVERFGPMIFSFGLRMCGNREDAEDVLQETLIKVYTRLRTLQDPDALRAWLWRIVANECRMSRRGPRDPGRQVNIEELLAPREEGGTPMELPDPDAPDPEASTIRLQDRERLEEAIRNLPPTYRIILLLRDFEGLTSEEVARVLGISVPNAKVRLHRARLALRRLLLGAEPPRAARGSG